MSHASHFVPGQTPDGEVTRGQRNAANRRMDAHVLKKPRCESADVCVHPGFLFTSYFCTGCNRSI